jgi:hypothetical protein
MLGAAVAAIAVALAGSAEAATHIVDFENYNVGDVILGPVPGLPFSALAVRGEIVAGPTGNALKLTAIPSLDNVGFYLRDRFTGTWSDPDTHTGKIVYQPVLASMDYFSSIDATLQVLSHWGTPVFGLDGGSWSSLSMNHTVDETTYYVRTSTPYLLIDNLAFVENYGVVPEPATWAMMIAGFGLTGAVIRRRRPSYV